MNSIALIIALIWAYKSNWDFEPLIAVLSLSATLIAFFMSRDKQSLIQNQKSGGNSSNIQSGRDTNINR